MLNADFHTKILNIITWLHACSRHLVPLRATAGEALAPETEAQHAARLHLGVILNYWEGAARGRGPRSRGARTHPGQGHGGTRFLPLPLVMGKAEAQDRGGRKWRNEEALLPAQESHRHILSMAALGRQVRPRGEPGSSRAAGGAGCFTPARGILQPEPSGRPGAAPAPWRQQLDRWLGGKGSREKATYRGVLGGKAGVGAR